MIDSLYYLSQKMGCERCENSFVDYQEINYENLCHIMRQLTTYLDSSTALLQIDIWFAKSFCVIMDTPIALAMYNQILRNTFNKPERNHAFEVGQYQF